jgi:hypothetical protein
MLVMTTRNVFLAGYLLVGLSLLGLALLADRRPSVAATVDELADAATRRRTGRVIVLILWWWLGFHVLARSA